MARDDLECKLAAYNLIRVDGRAESDPAISIIGALDAYALRGGAPEECEATHPDMGNRCGAELQAGEACSDCGSTVRTVDGACFACEYSRDTCTDWLVTWSLDVPRDDAETPQDAALQAAETFRAQSVYPDSLFPIFEVDGQSFEVARDEIGLDSDGDVWTARPWKGGT